MLHLYMRSNYAPFAARQLAEIDSVIGVSIHVGNSDVLGDIIYRNIIDILDIISKARKIEGVERVAWSEEVYSVPITRSRREYFPISSRHRLKYASLTH
jgi:hypothetical protein